jgi:hypothetical protein
VTRKSERKRVRKELVATYLRSNPTEGYDAISKRVNEEIAKLGEDATFADLAGIDRKLRLPRGTSFEMSGFADYFEFMGDD